MSFPARVFLALIGGVVVGAIVLALAAGLFYGLAPRRVPIGFFLLPFMGFFLGAAIGYNADKVYRNVLSAIDEASTNMRLWGAFSALWMIVVVVVFSVFTPFGRYHDMTRWYGHEWFKFLSILLGPAVVSLIGVQLFAWATRRGKPKHLESKVRSVGEQDAQSLNIYQVIANAIAVGDITPAFGVELTKRYEELLQRSGDRKSARLQLADWLEQEMLRRRAGAREEK